MVELPLNMTIQEFEAFLLLPENIGRRFELVDGQPLQKITSTFYTSAVTYIQTVLRDYLATRPIGEVVTQTNHTVSEESNTRYQSDIAVILDDITSEQAVGDAVTHLPDFIIELKPPNQTHKHQRDKVDFYLAHGAKLVWLILPAKRLIEVYRLNGDIDILTDANILDGDGVLKGLTLPVYTIFDSPSQPIPRPPKQVVTLPPLAPDTPLIPPSSYPLHPWQKKGRQKVYYATTPADGDRPTQHWPIQFTVYHFELRFSRMIWAVMAILIACFVLTHNILNFSIYHLGLNLTAILRQHEYYRMFTFSLLHVNLLHLVSNLIGIWLMGRRLEPVFGWYRMGVLIFFSTLFTGLSWVMFTSYTYQTSVGASGIVYTLLGAALMHILVNRKVLGHEYWGHWVRLLALIVGFVIMDLVSNARNSFMQIDILWRTEIKSA